MRTTCLLNNTNIKIKVENRVYPLIHNSSNSQFVYILYIYDNNVDTILVFIKKFSLIDKTIFKIHIIIINTIKIVLKNISKFYINVYIDVLPTS